jgi:6-phospho-beta-glucosidase
MRAVLVDGQDVLPDLLADDRALDTLEESSIFGMPWLRTLNCIPNEYLYYYYFNRDAVAAIGRQPATRGEFLTRQQADFYAAAAAAPRQALRLWREASSRRRALYMAEAKGGRARPEQEPPGEGGYAGVALGVMNAIAGNRQAAMILNVRNAGALAGLDEDAVVELPCTVDASGAHPIPAVRPDLHQLGLMQQVKAVERLTIEAAATGSPDAALKAFALHPLVDSVSVARDLLSGYLAVSQAP